MAITLSILDGFAKFFRCYKERAINFQGEMGKLISVLLKIYLSSQQRKNFANRSKIDTVIAMVRVAHFFDLRCILQIDLCDLILTTKRFPKIYF